jgi:hypothetical protein
LFTVIITADVYVNIVDTAWNPEAQGERKTVVDGVEAAALLKQHG